MKRERKTTSRRAKARTQEVVQVDGLATPVVHKRNAEPLKGMTEAQSRYIAAIKQFDVVIGEGPAGTGKTYIAGALAAQALDNGAYERIVVTRPAVEAGECLGFLPGEIQEKYEPYMAPFREVLQERLGRSYVDYLIKTGRIQAVPLAYMRGMSFHNTFVILDEAQNTTDEQMKMFLTRHGRNCKMVIDGDLSQKDIHKDSGLADALKRITWIPNVKVINFSVKDIVRSGFVSDVIKSYSTPSKP